MGQSCTEASTHPSEYHNEILGCPRCFGGLCGCSSYSVVLRTPRTSDLRCPRSCTPRSPDCELRRPRSDQSTLRNQARRRRTLLQILKPALGAAATIAVATPTVEVVKSVPVEHEIAVHAPVVAAHAFVPATTLVHTPAVVNLKAAIPAGDAPPPSELVQTEKVLAPVRASSKITPELTVQLPTKVNVEKVAVDVPVAAPYAHPVPVPVTTHHHVGVATHTHISAHPTLLTHTL